MCVRERESARERFGRVQTTKMRFVIPCVQVRQMQKSDGFFLFCLYPGGERDPQAAASSRWMQQEAVR